MNDKSHRIPLSVDIERILQVLAAQIYQSPMALLRENTQNAFDAILLRRAEGQKFEPRIDVTITNEEIVIHDNGIGMTKSDIENHFWRAGASSKNTEHAKAAGVVGTFGIGAMANFGIARQLVVETESALTSERTKSTAERDSLSATEDCIEVSVEEPTGESGTKVTAIMYKENPVDLTTATHYLQGCVQHLAIPVYVNGELISEKPLTESVPEMKEAWQFEDKGVQLGSEIVADVRFAGDVSGGVSVALTNVSHEGKNAQGSVLLRSGVSRIGTYRSGFSLATTSVHSVYKFGGVADLGFLHPTAGREALDSTSQQILQNLIGELETKVSLEFSKHTESGLSSSFMQWSLKHGRFDLCDNVRIRVEPGNQEMRLLELRPVANVLLYEGQEPTLIEAHASDESKLTVAARNNPRRGCQLGYIEKYCEVTRVHDKPMVLQYKDPKTYTFEESGFVFRVTSILETDYFLTAQVSLAQLSHNLPILLDDSEAPPQIALNPDASSAKTLLQLYQTEFDTFGRFAKDFVRTIVFPKVSHLVPSATREGAEAFLKRMRYKREKFELGRADLGSLSEIWADVLAGHLSVQEGARRSQIVAQRSYQVVDSSSAQSASEVLQDVKDEEELDSIEEPGTSMPAISRSDVETDAKLLIVEDTEQPVNGYRCFLSLTDRIREEKGEFFLQPHSTSIVWGGQRVLFVFEHHSGRFGLYYDIQASEVVSSESGGGPVRTSTIFLKNKIFIPIPSEIQESFIPIGDERRRFEVRCDILYTEDELASLPENDA